MNNIINSFNFTSSPYLKAVITILIFLVLAKFADIFFSRLLRKFTSFTRTDLDDRIIGLVHRPVFYTVLFMGIALSLSYPSLSEKVRLYTESLLYSLLIIVWMITIIRFSSLIIEHFVQKQADTAGLRREIVPIVENISKITVIAIALMVLLSVWDINITPLVASAGIAGAVVAFAAKDAMANIFGGISIFIDRPFKVGDYIILDQGERGEVVSIGIRSTRIKTRDDILITIPNSIIANSKIINESAPVPKFRMKVPVSVAYGSDIDLVERVLLEIARGNDSVSTDPEPRVRFRAFGDSALNFELLCWTDEPAYRGRILHELNSEIYRGFSRQDIRIPFPQRDLHIYREEM
jgi:small-conductance mechanosensitive channel